ncbi:MAG: hypothetical protein ACXWSC_04730, partial [Bdellovibrionota bacterium]
MKLWKFTLATFFLCTSLSALAADDGTDRGNPGDEYSKEFVSLGYDLSENLAKDPVPGVDARALLAAVQATTLHSEASLQLRGFDVDAINYPDSQKPQIVVSRQGWDRMAAEPHRRVFLVLHEYLSIMGIDDSKYQISGLLDRAQVCSRSAQVREGIERQLKKSCYRVIPDDLQYVPSLYFVGKGMTRLLNSDFKGLIGLENLYLQNNDIQSVDEGFFRAFPQMDSFNAGTAIKSLADCSWLASMPAVRGLTFGNGMDFREKFRPLDAIAPGCFSAAGKLNSLTLDIDGVTTTHSGFLQGISSTIGYLTVEGTNLEKMDLRELKSPARQLNLVSFGLPFTADFAIKLQKVLGKNCTLTQTSSVNGPTLSMV